MGVASSDTGGVEGAVEGVCGSFFGLPRMPPCDSGDGVGDACALPGAVRVGCLVSEHNGREGTSLLQSGKVTLPSRPSVSLPKEGQWGSIKGEGKGQNELQNFAGVDTRSDFLDTVSSVAHEPHLTVPSSENPSTPRALPK